MSNTNRGYSGTTGVNSFMSIAVLADSTGAPTARSRRLNVPGVSNGDADTYDQNRLQLSDLINVSATTATTSAVTGNVHPAAMPLGGQLPDHR